MCGFVGMFHFNRQPVDPQLLSKMRDSMIHRGPDDEGIYTSGPVGLGFRRLSIIDLAGGHQPMANHDQTMWLVFNGEIYNYQELQGMLRRKGRNFKTESDSEVILHLYELYGEECVAYLNGMFSFVIWDERRQRIFAARDRIGIKPFYYYLDDERLIVASEIKAIIEDRTVKRQPNYEAILDYLQYMYVLGDKTFFKGIKKLMPGHTLSSDLSGNSKIKQYWDVSFRHDHTLTEETASEMILGTLRDSVKIHLRSDVPLGCHLSGGIDSSAITCLSRELLGDQHTLKTFSGKFAEDPFYDETKYAKAVAEHAKTNYLEVVPQGLTFPDVMDRMTWVMDEPAVGPGLFPQYFVSKLASEHVKVVLGGQGGDELFGGYPRYFLTTGTMAATDLVTPGTSSPRTSSRFNKIHFLLNYLKRRGIRMTINKALQYLSVRSSSPEEKWKHFSTSMALDVSLLGSEVLSTYHSYDSDVEFFKYVNSDNAEELFDKLLYHDFKTYLPALLQVEDRTSMAVSIESRVPMLDYRLVELAAKIPPGLKVKMGDPKYILKDAVRNVIPKEVLERTDKKGFPTPINYWFKNELRNYLNESLLDKRSLDRGMFQPKQLQEALNKKEDNSWELWALLNVELWFKKFID
ncbi:asparagine synthase (glutamine-hydrolyzing) [Brevibacillus sp. HB1.4B]|uniref:asparagine synthase (glutamine-hydrolyzing) n=1 Tax=Brevibacillus TaxID=55080 RepID=UPI00035E6D21|nr:asparagine synthase (glutamine-hydrolyzing) [Brevibacillus sp. HB1.4B]ATF15955.1 asparagine synthetase B [Brevibacillus brevis X23]NRS18468.1 asparagine synthase (glutamine-hydrolyzing) [Brevibacillus sp. HB1.4B]